MRGLSGLADLLVSLDAFPRADEEGCFDWPMNETSLVMRLHPDGGGLHASIDVGTFRDGADLCFVTKGRTPVQGCGDGCPACRIDRRPEESDERFLKRAYAFCDRLCERMVLHEDRFLSGFAT